MYCEEITSNNVWRNRQWPIMTPSQYWCKYQARHLWTDNLPKAHQITLRYFVVRQHTAYRLNLRPHLITFSLQCSGFVITVQLLDERHNMYYISIMTTFIVPYGFNYSYLHWWNNYKLHVWMDQIGYVASNVPLIVFNKDFIHNDVLMWAHCWLLVDEAPHTDAPSPKRGNSINGMHSFGWQNEQSVTCQKKLRLACQLWTIMRRLSVASLFCWG